ncbi:hypothetical protein B0H13DRAFT_2279487 [Mycena leptocephala]|nr:hypothetical protein B0H13DRAFT_2279487 [Mycena leptocephala]
MAIGINGDSNEVDFQPQSSLLSKELDQPSYTESEALADAEELERLRNQTVCRHPKCGLRALTSGQPSPVKTEPCYDSWDSGEIMLLFKNSGIMKIRDFGYPPDDPRHGGDTLLLSRSEDDTRNARNAISLSTPPPTPASSGVMAPTTFPTHRFIAPENLPILRHQRGVALLDQQLFSLRLLHPKAAASSSPFHVVQRALWLHLNTPMYEIKLVGKEFQMHQRDISTFFSCSHTPCQNQTKENGKDLESESSRQCSLFPCRQPIHHHGTPVRPMPSIIAESRHVAYSYLESQWEGTVTAAFRTVKLPSVQTIVLPSYTHAILAACLNVRDVSCNEEIGAKLFNTFIKCCSKVERIQGFELTSTKLKDLSRSLPKLREIAIPTHMDISFLSTIGSLSVIEPIAKRWEYVDESEIDTEDLSPGTAYKRKLLQTKQKHLDAARTVLRASAGEGCKASRCRIGKTL